MELIVKIGADQQGLADVVQRMKDTFKNMNTSMPGGWSPHMSHMNQYGNVMQSANAGGAFDKFKNGLSELSPTIGGLVSKLSSVAGPIGAITAALGGLGMIANSVANKISESAALSRQSRITGASAGMLKHVSRAADLAGIDKDSAFMAINRMNAQAGNFNNGDKEAQDLFGEIGIDPSGQSVDAVLAQVKKQFSGISDPAKRARLSKGLFGRSGFEMTELFSKLETGAGANMFESEDIEQIAAAKRNSKKLMVSIGKFFDDTITIFTSTGLKTLGLTKGARTGSFSQTIGEEVAGEIKKEIAKKAPDAVAGGGSLQTLYRWSDGTMHSSREPKEKADIGDEKPLGFQADAMAQAGLFTGSSLLLNPNFSVQQQQLEALTAIRANTDKIGDGTFT